MGRGKLPQGADTVPREAESLPCWCPAVIVEADPNITAADTKKDLGYSSTDQALSSSGQQTSKQDVDQWLADKGKREKISRDLENMTEEMFT